MAQGVSPRDVPKDERSKQENKYNDLAVGDRIKIISPGGVKTAFGTTPRVNAYDVAYIFSAGRWDIDRTRVYMPFGEAQAFFDQRDDPGIRDRLAVAILNDEGIHDLVVDCGENLCVEDAEAQCSESSGNL